MFKTIATLSILLLLIPIVRGGWIDDFIASIKSILPLEAYTPSTTDMFGQWDGLPIKCSNRQILPGYEDMTSSNSVPILILFY